MKKVISIVMCIMLMMTCTLVAVAEEVEPIRVDDAGSAQSPVEIKTEPIAQRLLIDKPFTKVQMMCPSYSDNIGAITFTLYEWKGSYDETVAGTPLVTKTNENFNDNSWIGLEAGEGKAFAAGEYLCVITDPVQKVGIWKAVFENLECDIVQESFVAGEKVDGCFRCRVYYAQGGEQSFAPGQEDSGNADNPAQVKPVDSNNVIMYVDAPKAFVKGEEKALDVAPVVVNGRTLLPARFVAESIGAKVDWYEETQVVAIEKGDLLVTLVIGSNEMRVNGELTILDVPAQTINDRTVVPLRAICEALGQQVNYFPDGDKGLIVVGLEAESFSEAVAAAFVSLYK